MQFQKFTKKFQIAILSFSISISAANADTLKGFVDQTIKVHPEVNALASNQLAVSEELVAAKGLALPGVNVEKSIGRYKDSNTNQDYSEYSLTLRQPIFDGGKTYYETSRQTERVNSARNRLLDTANAIGLQAVQAYLEVLRAREVLGIADKNLKTIKGIYGRVKSRVKGGGGSQADLDQAQGRLYAAYNSEAEAQLQLLDAEALYKVLTNQNPGKLSLAKLPVSYAPRSVDQAIEEAMNASPKILAMQNDAAAAEHAIGTARSSLMPTVDLELSANYRDSIVGTSAESTNYKAMVVFKMNLYNGGINTARVREAKHRSQEASSLADAAKMNVNREIRLAWNKYHGSAPIVKALKSQAQSNRATLRARLAQYNSGQSSLISILDAQGETLVAEVSSINESYAGRFSFYKLLAASGKLLDALNVPLPEAKG